MIKYLVAGICALFWALTATTAAANQSTIENPLQAHVDISSQTMTVVYNGKAVYQWPVSTARPGKVTPRGTFKPQFLSKNHKSSRYNNAPMPYAIFFRGHYAIHGTDQVAKLGHPASAGCVRLHPDHASILFSLTQQVGMKNMQVVVR